MKVLIFVSAILLSACATKPGREIPGAPDNSAANALYEELVESIKTRDNPADFAEIRRIYIHTDKYKPYFGPEMSLSKTMFNALQAENWDQCIESSEQILNDNFISLNAHYGAMVCFYKSEKADKGEKHRSILDGLLDAIRVSGDGRSAQTAFYSTSTAELRAFLQLQGLEIVDQALVHDQGRAFDLMGVRDPQSGEEFSLYFDITAQWARGFKGLE